jgi:hypothetical protein
MAALEKAVGGLQDEAVKAHIQEDLQGCATALHERLLSLQAAAAAEAAQEEPEPEPEQAAKAAKRPKRSRKGVAAAEAEAAAPTAEAEAEMAEEEEPLLLPLPVLATAGGYRQLAAAAAAGQPDARFSAADLLLSRKLPTEELVRAHVQRLQLSAAVAEPAGDASAELGQQVAAARASLGICSALSCEAASPEDALRMFAPAVSQLEEASQLLQQQKQAEGGAPAAAPAIAALLQELTQLASRALAAMHAALQLQRQALAGSAASSSFWRSNQRQSAAEAADVACTVSATLCSLCTALRMHAASGSQAAGRQRQQLEALSAGAAADLRQLAPYAASGQLAHLAATVSHPASLAHAALLWPVCMATGALTGCFHCRC